MNRLTRHKYHECSDLPALRPIFSCAPCDEWRQRVLSVHFKDRCNLDRSKLSARYQCQRKKKGYGCIRVRVTYNDIALSSSPVADSVGDVGVVEANKTTIRSDGEVVPVSEATVAKSLRAKRLEHSLKQRSAVSEATVAKSVRAKRLERSLKERSAKIQLEKENISALKNTNAVLTEELHSTKKVLLDELDNANEKFKSKENELLDELDATKKKLKTSQGQVKHYKSQVNCQAVDVSDKNSMKKFCKVIEKAVAMALPGRHIGTKAKMVLDALSSGMLFSGEGVRLLNELHRDYIRHVFKPWKLVKAYDCSSIGAFKTATIKALHSVLDENNIGFFPSPSTIDRARKQLDEHCMKVIGCERKITRHGEVYVINHERAIRLLLKATGLYEKAQRTNVHLAFTADGAALTKSRTHVSCGVKITDPDGMHPVTGLPLGSSNADEPDGDDDEEKTIFNFMQSRELCTILVIADARDSKDLYYDVFRDFFDYAKKISEHGIEANDDEPKLQPFIISFPQDMKSAQITSKKGGCCKPKRFFCHLCSCTKDGLVSFNVNEFRCDRCKRRGRIKCYHHDVCDSTTTKELLLDLEEEMAQYCERYEKDLATIKKESKLRTDPAQVDKETDVHHIDFVIPDNDRAKKNEYVQFIAKECRIRNIPIMGSSVLEWRDALRACAVVERRLHLLVQLKNWYEEGNETIPLIQYIELLIPCILHLENRVGEKIVTMILRKGLEMCRVSSAAYVGNLQTVFQRSILGTEQSPSHWKMRYTKDDSGIITIEAIQERNSVVRAMMEAHDRIIQATTPAEYLEFRDKLLLACSKYQAAMNLLTVHRILDDEEQEEFQDLIDDFFEIWVGLFGRAGVTNYIHLLGSGHIYYFLKKYRCLYIYSQQGWEALNSVCTGFILQNSARGGYGSGEGKGKSYIYPLVRYLMRDLLWKTREADRFFIQIEENKNRH